MKIRNLQYLLIIIMLPFLHIACSKDELDSKELKVYVNTGNHPANVYGINYIHSRHGIEGEVIAKFVVKTTRSTSVPIEAKMIVDNSYVEIYNSRTDNEYKEIPKNNYSIQGNIRIEQGKMVSDSVVIEIKNKEQLNAKEGYVLPLRIANLNTDDKGVEISSNLNMVYLVISNSFIYVDQENTSVDGTVLDRSNWKVKSPDYYGNFYIENAFDGKNNTGWFSPTYDRNPYVEIDMGKEESVKGFRLTSFYAYGSDYAPAEIVVYTSMDGKKWDNVGIALIEEPASGTNASSPDIKPINFYTTVESRYFKLEVTSSYSYYMGIAEINIVK